MHDGGPIKSTRARETEVSDENRSILSRSQPGRLRSFTFPVRALHFHAGAGFGDVFGRGLTAKGAVPVAALFTKLYFRLAGPRGKSGGRGQINPIIINILREMI